MGLPFVIRNSEGKLATIELNKSDFIVCRYHPNNSVYLHDANLTNWYPQHWFRRRIYSIRVRLMR